MEVCILTTSYPRFKGDYAGIFIHNLAKNLVKNGIKVKVVAPNDFKTKSNEIIDEVEIFRFNYWFIKKHQKLCYGGGIPNNIKNSLLAKLQIPFFIFSFFLNSLTISKKCKIIHAHFLLSGFISIPIKFLTKKSLITTVHGSDLRSISTLKIIKKFMIKIDYFISPHPELTEILNKFNIDGKNILEIPNIISFGEYEFEDSKDSIKCVNNEFGLKNEQVVTYITRFNEMKDPLTFIKSIPYVIQKRKNVKFFLIGDGPLMGDVKQLVKKLEIDSYVILPGYRDDIRRFLERTDIFLTISNVENIWSMTLIEAIKTGVPCILTKVGYTKKIFTNFENACLISSGDPKELSLAILKLLKDDKLRKKLSENAKILIAEKGFNNNKIIKRTICVYQKLLK